MRTSTLGSNDAAGALVAPAAVLVGVAIGLLSVVSPPIAVAGLIAAIIVPAAIVRPSLVLYFLTATVFTQALTVGGLTISRLAAPIGLIAVISQVLNQPPRVREARTVVTLTVVFSLVTVSSLIWTLSVKGTMSGLASLAISLVYMAAFAIFVRNETDLRRIIAVLVGSGIALAGLWLAQFASGVDRTRNVAGDPNFVAAFLVLSLPLSLVLASSSKTAMRRLVINLGVALQAAAVIATLSRSGLGALVLALGLMLVLPVRTLELNPLQKVAFLLSAAIGLAVIIPIAGPQLAQRFRQADQQEGVVGARGDLWRSALYAYRQHELTGIGYGAYAENSFTYLAQTPGVNLIRHLRFQDQGEPVHNAYLETLTELGPIGLALFLGILVETALSLRRTARRARASGDAFLRATANALLIGLISYGASSFLLSTETSRALWMLVGLRIALPGVAAVRERQAQEAAGEVLAQPVPS